MQRRNHLTGCLSCITRTLLWAMELARFPLVAGGGEWSGPNMLQWCLFWFMLGLCGGWGEILRHMNVSETAHILWDAAWASNAKCALVDVSNNAFKICWNVQKKLHTWFYCEEWKFLRNIFKNTTLFYGIIVYSPRLHAQERRNISIVTMYTNTYFFT